MKNMKKLISIALSAIMFLNLSLCIFAEDVPIPPPSAGGIIGDQEDGYISGYKSACPVFAVDENENLLALATGNTGTSYEYRTGDMYDTGWLDDTVLHGRLNVTIDGAKYNWAIFSPPGNELEYTGVTPLEQVDLTEKFDVFSFYHHNAAGGQYHQITLSNFNPETQIAEYKGFDDFMSSGVSRPDTLAPVYYSDDTLLGFLINEYQMITVQGVKNFMSDPNCFTVAEELPIKTPVVERNPRESYEPQSSHSTYVGFSGLVFGDESIKPILTELAVFMIFLKIYCKFM
jgi:hypothetical protein